MLINQEIRQGCTPPPILFNLRKLHPYESPLCFNKIQHFNLN